MQTTLLGLAIALILALVAALVGPHFVDWSRYRADFEWQASQLAGAPVRISGPVDIRFLPTPFVALHSVELALGETSLSARELRLELALGSLMRGEWRASELNVSEPRIRLVLDGAGRLPAFATAFEADPDRLAVERLTIENGRVILVNGANGGALTLDKFSFEGALRSLVGPIRGDGAFVAGDGPYRFRIAAGRRSDDGAKLRLNLERIERPLAVEADGVLRFEDASPRFNGAVTVARPAGAALVEGRKLVQEPWRATAQAKADPRGVLLDPIDLQYGSDERSVRASGKGTLAFAPQLRFDGALAGRQINLDRLIGPPAAGQRSPRAALGVAAAFVAGGRVPIPGKLDLDVEALTLGGTALQNVSGKFDWDGDRLAIEGLEFRAPGLTQVRLGGGLRAGPLSPEFSGPVSFDSANPGALLSWLEGRSDGPRAPLESLRASGDVTIGANGVAVEKLQAEIDRKPIAGRIAVTLGGGPSGAPRIDAALNAPEVDLDGALALARGALVGASLEWPRDVTLALSIGKASYAGVGAGRVEARLKLDASGLTLERFSIADLRGANVEATGLIDTASPSPQGAVSVSVAAARADELLALAGSFAPQAAEALKRHAGQLGPADLRARFELAPVKPDPAQRPAAASSAAAATQAKLALDGKLGAAQIHLVASGTGAASAPRSAKVKVNGTVEADDGRVLAALSGLDRLITIDARPAALSFDLGGALDGDLAFNLRASAGGLWASLAGAAREEKGAYGGRAQLSLTAMDARMLLNPGAMLPLPLSLETRIALAGDTVAFEDIGGRIAGAAVKGRLGLKLASPLSVDGRIEASEVEAGPAIALAMGAARKATGRERAPRWSGEPFGRRAFADVTGGVDFEAARAGLLPGLEARNLKGRLNLDGASLALADVKGSVAGGALTADATFRVASDGLSARVRFALSKADLSQITFGRDKPPATGRVSLSAEIEGSGRSPATLIGALQGSGALTVENAQIAGLDPKAIDAAIRAADRGLALDRVAGYLGTALDGGALLIPAATGALAIADGRARLVPLVANADGAELAVSATLDIPADALDARVTLRAAARRDEAPDRRPEVSVVLAGPLDSPQRTVDAAALVSFATLRAVERESKRVEAAEREAKRRAEAAAAAERAAQQRAEDERLARERGREGERATGAAPAGPGSAALERAPALPPPIEIKPSPAQSARPAKPPPVARPAQPPTPAPPQPPPNRSLWDDLFGRR